MTWQGQTVLAVVPARGGSKSVPRKNLQVVNGLSLVAHAARLAGSLSWVDAAIVSTEDSEIAREARAHGLDVPFRRPDTLAGDLSRSEDVWRHAWSEAEKTYERRFDISVLLQPTSPVRDRSDVESTVRTLVDGQCPAAVTVSRTPAHFTPEKTLTIDGEGRLRPYLSNGIEPIRQLIPDYYYPNGICYAVTRETLVDEGQILAAGCGAVITERPTVNIDEPFDLELAEWLMSRSSTEEITQVTL